MAVPRTGYEPSRRSTRRQGGVTGSVDRAIGFANQTAIEYRMMRHGRVTGWLGDLPRRMDCFREFGDTGLYTLDYVAARANGGIPGGALHPWAASTDVFHAQHGSLNPATHVQAGVSNELIVAQYDDLCQVFGMAPGAWSASAVAQAQLVAAGWTGVVGPVNVYSPPKNSERPFSVQNVKHQVTRGLGQIKSVKEVLDKFSSALVAGQATVTIGGRIGDIRVVGGGAPAPRATNVGNWPVGAPTSVPDAFDQFMTVTFGGVFVDVLAIYSWGLPATTREASGINVASATAVVIPNRNTVGHLNGCLGWFVSSEFTDNNNADGLDPQRLFESATVTEFQLLPAAERPIPIAAGATNSADAFSMAVDSILGQLAYGSSYDGLLSFGYSKCLVAQCLS